MNKEIDSGLNLYEFNRVNMGKLPLLKTEEEIDKAKSFICKYLDKPNVNYYMLLNHENKDFTLFNLNSFSEAKTIAMACDIIECMENRNFGLLNINLDEAEIALEIWVKDLETEAVFMYLLFPYDNGVIEY